VLTILAQIVQESSEPIPSLETAIQPGRNALLDLKSPASSEKIGELRDAFVYRSIGSTDVNFIRANPIRDLIKHISEIQRVENAQPRSMVNLSPGSFMPSLINLLC
jgi:hypothetical protein